MKITTVIKRSGKTVPYEKQKIFNAINGANNDVDKPYQISDNDINQIIIDIEEELDKSCVTVEEIQDIIEKALMENKQYEIAKAYILYRQKHKEYREAKNYLMETYKDIFFSDAIDIDLKRDNANINTDAPMGIMLKLGTEGSKYFVDNYLIPPEFVQADKENWIHIHDKDFSAITFNCCQIDLLKLFHDGFSTGHGFLREPQSIRSYASLACIAIQSNQNDMLGGQSINAWDYAMAEGVRKSFKRAVTKQIKIAAKYNPYLLTTALNNEGIDNLISMIDWLEVRYFESISEQERVIRHLTEFLLATSALYIKHSNIPKDEVYDIAKTIYKLACKEVEEETHQAMEAAIHNFNSLHSRAGSQTPFSSLNYGMDTSPEGRLVIRETLNAINAGLGNGETPIFPISIFVLKTGVNYNPEDPNYDLFKLAMKVSAKRLFPNFESLDAPFNKQYYKPNDYNSYVATMGCRTRVMGNVNGPEISGSRGNFSFVTINLPKLAIESNKDLNTFFQLFDKYIKLSHDYLLHRLSVIENKHVYNFPFLMGQHVWLDSDKLKPTDTIKEVLKHASYSIGFCGLAECLKYLIGKHHGESKTSQKLGLKIVEHLRKRTDEYTEKEHMNWTAFATPAESTAGTFQRANQKAYGIIEGVTDREYMTNSFHVPVYYPINAFKKIQIEAPYHALTNAGHISYIEMDGDPTKNLKAFEALVRAMHDANMGYFSINHPVDRDPVCGYTGIIENECPHCHRKEIEHKKISIKRDKSEV